jgi:YidC/Oxa1 family membrane protein insertase
METKRFIVFIALSFSILFAWQKWFAPKVPQQPAAAEAQAGSATPAATAGTTATADTSGSLLAGNRIKVKTDMVEAEIDTMGADLRKLSLLKAGEFDDAKKPLVLLQDSGDHIYVAHTGLIHGNVPNLATHNTLFTATQTGDVALADGQDSVSVRLEAPVVAGVKVAKIYTFKRGSYVIDVKYEINNGGTVPLTTQAYYSLYRDGKPPKGPSSRFAGSAFTGPAVYTNEAKFHEVEFKALDKGDDSKIDYPKDGRDGWVAMLQHYFASAWLLSPNGGTNVCAKTACQFEVQATGNGFYKAGAIVTMPVVAPGATETVTVPLYAGPETTRTLQVAAAGLDRVRDYGKLTIIAEPMFWALDKCFDLVHNWGWAIMLVTLLIKIAFYPLASTSYRSMAKMKKLAPRMQRLKEQYGEDRVKFQQATMELYKSEKVNPLGGCLPLLLQIPFFFAFYTVLRNTAEMRQAPWIFWIHDLSVADPYYVLPLLMASTMYLQTFLNPSTGDPMQDRMQKIMPLMFSFMFFALPAGLVLYQVTQSVLSMAQQWFITRQIAKADPVPAKA